MAPESHQCLESSTFIAGLSVQRCHFRVSHLLLVHAGAPMSRVCRTSTSMIQRVRFMQSDIHRAYARNALSSVNLMHTMHILEKSGH